ncbi:MAG TPA: hypothetical protein DCZ41_04690 [Firmicutes bacterium]|nr:hypothetical protein [Bacillota bacterium]
MKFTLLKSLLLKEGNVTTFSLRDNKLSERFPFPLSESAFEPYFPQSEKEEFHDLLTNLRKEGTIDLSIPQDYALRHILFLSYLESFGEENIYSLLGEYKKEADDFLLKAKGLQIKRLSDYQKEGFLENALAGLAKAKTNPEFAKALFEAPLEVTPIAKIFFHSPFSFWKGPPASPFLSNEYDFLKSDPLSKENLAKKKYDFLIGLFRKEATPNVLREYYLDLLKKHLVFIDDFFFYPLTKDIGLSLLNPFYWMNIQQSVKDQYGRSFPIAKPGLEYSVFGRKGLYKEPYCTILKESGAHFEYKSKELRPEEAESLNSLTKKEASYFLFS